MSSSRLVSALRRMITTLLYFHRVNSLHSCVQSGGLETLIRLSRLSDSCHPSTMAWAGVFAIVGVHNHQRAIFYRLGESHKASRRSHQNLYSLLLTGAQLPTFYLLLPTSRPPTQRESSPMNDRIAHRVHSTCSLTRITSALVSACVGGRYPRWASSLYAAKM